MKTIKVPDMMCENCVKRITNALTEAELKFGPNIADWPKMDALNDNILLVAASVINDEVTNKKVICFNDKALPVESFLDQILQRIIH